MLKEIFSKHWENYDPDIEKTKSVLSDLIDQHILVACSGGADSIALAILAYCNNLNFSVAYIEHEISPLTAQCEVNVKQLAEDLGAEFHTVNLKMTEKKLADSNIEAKARELRYEALNEIQDQINAEVILTAHHMDDMAETFLINLIRGSGSGIASLATRRENLLRPLLHWRKANLVGFVNACGYEYFVDPGNTDTRFVRNRIRNEVIGLLNEISNRDVVPLLVRASESLSQDNEFLARYASSLWPQDDPDTRALSALDPVIQKHAIRSWIKGYPPSHEELMRILDVVNHKIRSTQISGDRTIWRTNARLYQEQTSKIKDDNV